MNRARLGALLGGAGIVAIAIGCGGSTSAIDSNGGGDSGAPTPPPPPPAPPPAPQPAPPPPPSDAGNDVDDIAAPTVTIQYMASCPAFTPCDASPLGTWTLQGGCISSTLFADAKSSCPGFDVTNVTITAKGITTIDATTVSQKSHSDFTGKIFLPSSCTMGVSGAGCAFVGPYLQMAQYGGFDTATCADSGNASKPGCLCDVTKATTTSSSDTYTFTAGLMTTGSGLKYDLCVNPASTLTIRQQNTNGTPGPATFTAMK
ncbi:MAG TPA: hypothetical protein VIF62_02625 [Labilithrix sp.]